jgi:hypothetical protein
MKKILFLLVVLICLVSCEKPPKYPRYTLVRTYCVPDSLKSKQREWIKETIRASNQHLTAGDYEDIDETIQQVEHTSNNLFEVSVFALRKEVDAEPSNDVVLKGNELTSYEKRLLESLIALE